MSLRTVDIICIYLRYMIAQPLGLHKIPIQTQNKRYRTVQKILLIQKNLTLRILLSVIAQVRTTRFTGRSTPRNLENEFLKVAQSKLEASMLVIKAVRTTRFTARLTQQKAIGDAQRGVPAAPGQIGYQFEYYQRPDAKLGQDNPNFKGVYVLNLSTMLQDGPLTLADT